MMHDEFEVVPKQPSRWHRFLCLIGFHKVLFWSPMWPHEAECERCGCKMLMDTHGRWFKP
jgi:hypothetical protein